MSDNKDSVFNLTKELLSNGQHIGNIKDKMKAHKDEIKAYDERNEVIMGELKVHTEDDNLIPDGY